MPRYHNVKRTSFNNDYKLAGFGSDWAAWFKWRDLLRKLGLLPRRQ